MKLRDWMEHYAPEQVPLEPEAQARIMAAVTEELPKEEGRGRNRRVLRMGVLAAALVAAMGITAAAWMQYSRSVENLAEEWQVAGQIDRELEEASMTEEQLAYLEGRTVPLDLSATAEGITVRLESITCTDHDVYVAWSCQADDEMTERYQLEENLLRPEFWDYYWENPGYGRILGQMATVDPEGRLEMTGWRSIPNDAKLCDGKTTLEVEIKTLAVITPTLEGRLPEECLAEITGSWNFTVELPQMDSAPEFTVDTAPLEEAFGVTDAVFQITSSGCRLVMPDSFALTDRAGIAECNDIFEGVTHFAVEFYLKDGTKIPDFGAGGEVKDGTVEYIIGWPPVIPEELHHVVVFDGETEVILPMK